MTKQAINDQGIDYIKHLEDKVMSIEKSHSYRIGLALTDFYSKKIGILTFLKRLISATKKQNKTNTYSNNKNNTSSVKTKNNLQPNIPLNNYKIGPIFDCNELIIGIMSDSDKKALMKRGCKIIDAEPMSTEDIIRHSNIDKFFIDINEIPNKKQWYGLGKIGETFRNKDFESIMEIVKEKHIVVQVKNCTEVTRYPTLMKHLNAYYNFSSEGNRHD